MKEYERLLLQNKAWAQERLLDDPHYFRRMAREQRPRFLWIGCSDSRVPADEITGTSPGEIFVHRNIANLVLPFDLNLRSVLEFAVLELEVQHVIVCGHQGCGGVTAALSRRSLGAMNAWLRNIKDVYRLHADELEALADPTERQRRLVELNVQEQVLNLARMALIQRTWKRQKRPHLHGWVYELQTGLIHTLCELPPGHPLAELDTFEEE